MEKTSYFLKHSFIATAFVSTLSVATNALATPAITAEQTMTYDNTVDNPLFFDNGTSVFGPLTITPSTPVPDAGEYWIQGDIRTSAIGIGSILPGDEQGAGHLHHFEVEAGDVSFAFFNDAGGVAFDAAGITPAGKSFAFNSLDFDTLTHDINVTGYITGDSSVSVVLDSSYSGSTVLFQDMDSRFGNVNLVEMWLNDTGRGIGGGPSDAFTFFDNVVIASPVPIPAALYLFLSGLIGLMSSRTFKSFAHKPLAA